MYTNRVSVTAYSQSPGDPVSAEFGATDSQTASHSRLRQRRSIRTWARPGCAPFTHTFSHRLACKCSPRVKTRRARASGLHVMDSEDIQSYTQLISVLYRSFGWNSVRDFRVQPSTFVRSTRDTRYRATSHSLCTPGEDKYTSQQSECRQI